jgi:PBP1b-binding outer membrane lipoprotein LpoB
MRYVLTLVFLLVLTGCFSSKITPSKQVTEAQDAVAKQEKKVVIFTPKKLSNSRIL